MFSQVFLIVNVVLIATYLGLEFRSRRLKKSQGGSTRIRRGIFMYNGHNFDAFEVLGITNIKDEGEIQSLIDAKWREVSQGERSDKVFIEAAIQSLKKK